MKKFLYYIMTFIEPRLENEIIKVLKKEKKLTVFDVGCYKGVFAKKILELIGKKKKLNFIYLMQIKM